MNKISTPLMATCIALSACTLPGGGNVSELDPRSGISSANEVYAPSAGTESSAAATSSVGDGSTSAEVMSQEEFDRLLALPPLTAGGAQVEQIIQPDDRRRITDTTTYPERVQVLIALPNGRCSGALVGPNLVVTAGHCVHSGGSGGAWQRSATVYPGKNGPLSPYGSCRARRFYSVVGWTRDRDANHDFGAIKLDCSVGNRTGWLGYFWQSASLAGMQARVSSYPGDKPLEQWSHVEPVTRVTALKTYYRTDTVPGNSGSAVFATTGVPQGCGGPCAHTVHAYGGSAENSGTRITKSLFDLLNIWKSEP